MKRKISIYLGLKAFNITLHNVDVILNNKYILHLEKMNTGKRVLISSDRFKDDAGNTFPFFRRPRVIEIRSKEGVVKLGSSDIIYED